MKKRFCFLLSLVMLHQVVLADDENKNANQWLVDFVQVGLSSAALTHEVEMDLSYKQFIQKKYAFDFKTKQYHFAFVKRIEQNWDILTRDGTEELPVIEKTYVSSKVEPWTNVMGTAKYSETYERVLPNWQHFNSLKALLSSLAKYGFDSPMNSMLHEDEIKALKKMHKSNDQELQKLWAQFSYDKKGNITEYAGRYTKRFIESSSAEVLILTNKNGEQCLIENLRVSIQEAVSGVRIYQSNKELIVFNEDLNKLLNKFAPSVFDQPQSTFEAYLRVLSEKSNKSFERFESGIAENE